MGAPKSFSPQRSSAQGLFSQNESTLPLAESLRPRSFEDLIPPPGIQEHHLESWKKGEGTTPNLILWGPPGAGKTTTARIIGHTYQTSFHELSAVTVGVKEVRAIVESAKKALQPTLLFLDEVHRFNKAQQDILLPWIENGIISFIGATTENPTFTLNGALLSRCEVIHLTGFDAATLSLILKGALEKKQIELSPEEQQILIKAAQQDARSLLRLLEGYVAVQDTTPSLQEYLSTYISIHYDRDGDEHFDSISAFIKSMRSGDVDSALYYGLRMIEAGEDPRYILRRMVIFASEDIGNAQPQALMLANQAAAAYERLGLPEGKIPISQAICFLATAPKSRASYEALRTAEQFIHNHPNIPVPLHLRNKSPIGMQKEEDAALRESSPLSNATFYSPKDSGYEAKLKASSTEKSSSIHHEESSDPTN